MSYIPDFENPGNINEILSKFNLLQKNSKTIISENEFIELINFYITNKQLKKGFTAYNFAKKIFPHSFDIKLSEAQLLIEAGLYSAAEKKLKILFRQKPDDLSLLLLFGLNYSNSGMTNKSISYFNKAIELIPKSQQADFMFSISQTFINSGRYDIAIFYLVNAHQLDPENDDIILDLAFCLEKTLKYEQSEKLFRAYLKRNPFSKIAWYNLGIVLFELNKLDKALEAFDFALAIDPDFTAALINKAEVLSNLNEHQQAIEILSKVLDFQPSNTKVLYARAKSFYSLKKYTEAVKDLKKTLKIDEKKAEAWYLLAKIYSLFSITYAKKSIFNALQYNKINSEYWHLAAKILSKEKNYKLADKAYSKAISFDPFTQKYWFEYAQNKIKQKNTDKAIFVLKIAKDFISDYFVYYQLLSTYYLNMGDVKNSLNFYKKAHKLNPQKAQQMLKTKIFRKNIKAFSKI